MSSLLITALDSQHDTLKKSQRNLPPLQDPHTQLPEQQPTPATAESPGVLVVARMAKGGIEYAVVSTALLCTLLNQPSLDLHEA